MRPRLGSCGVEEGTGAVGKGGCGPPHGMLRRSLGMMSPAALLRSPTYQNIGLGRPRLDGWKKKRARKLLKFN